MTIEACYEALGGSYADVTNRLPSQKLVEKFLAKFLDDQSFAELCKAMEAGSRPDAFRAAHTLKGVCANLSFNRLWDSAGKLTEVLRPENDAIPAPALPCMEEVRKDYEETVAVIRAYLGQA